MMSRSYRQMMGAWNRSMRYEGDWIIIEKCNRSSGIKKDRKAQEKAVAEGEASELKEEQDVKRKSSATVYIAHSDPFIDHYLQESDKSRIEVSLSDLKQKITKVTQENERLVSLLSSDCFS